MRAGELGGLQRRDVDLLRGVVHVRRALKDVNGHLELGPTKTHAQRTIALPAFLRTMLGEHLLRPDSGGTGPEAPVFTHEERRAAAARTRLRALLQAAAGLHVRGGSRRAADASTASASTTCGTPARRCPSPSGAHPKLIAARLGHSTITITLDRYGHLFPSVEEALADALDAAFAAETDNQEVPVLYDERWRAARASSANPM